MWYGKARHISSQELMGENRQHARDAVKKGCDDAPRYTHPSGLLFSLLIPGMVGPKHYGLPLLVISS